jgi:hypothetical protein
VVQHFLNEVSKIRVDLLSFFVLFPASPSFLSRLVDPFLPLLRVPSTVLKVVSEEKKLHDIRPTQREEVTASEAEKNASSRKVSFEKQKD